MSELDPQALAVVAAFLAILASVIVIAMSWRAWRQRSAEERWMRALEVDIDGVMRLREQIDLHTERALSDASALDMRTERLTREQASLVEQRENAVLETEHAHARLARAIETTARLESKVKAASERTARLRESVGAARDRRQKSQTEAHELETAIDELNATLAKLDEAHNEAEAEAREAEAQAKAAQKNRDQLERDVDALEHKVSLTDADVAAQRQRVETAKGQREALEAQQAEMQEQHDQLTQRLRRLETDEQVASTNLEEVTQAITALRDELATSNVTHVRQDVERLQKAVSAGQAELSVKQDERRQILEDLALLGRQKASYEGRRNVLEEELRLIGEQDKAAREHVAKAEAEMQTLTRELAAHEEQLKGHETRVHEQQGALHALNQTLAEATGELEAAMQRRNELRPKVETLRERNAKLAASLVESGARLSESRANVVDVWAEIDDALDELTRLGAAVNGREALTDALDLTAAAIATVGELAVELGRMAPGNSRHHPDPRILQAIATDAIDATLRDANAKIAAVRDLLLQAEDERDNIIEAAGVDLSAVPVPEPLDATQTQALDSMSTDLDNIESATPDIDVADGKTDDLDTAALDDQQESAEPVWTAEENEDILGDVMSDMIDNEPESAATAEPVAAVSDVAVESPVDEAAAESPAEEPADSASLLLEDAGEFESIHDFEDFDDDYEDPDRYSVLVDQAEESIDEDVVIAVVDD